MSLFAPAVVLRLVLVQLYLLTVLVVVVAMLWLGGPALRWFSVAMMIGLFAGTYSSIYIATSYALMMGLDKEDFIEKPKSELVEETFD